MTLLPIRGGKGREERVRERRKVTENKREMRLTLADGETDRMQEKDRMQETDRQARRQKGKQTDKIEICIHQPIVIDLWHSLTGFTLYQ